MTRNHYCHFSHASAYCEALVMCTLIDCRMHAAVLVCSYKYVHRWRGGRRSKRGFMCQALLGSIVKCPPLAAGYKVCLLHADQMQPLALACNPISDAGLWIEFPCILCTVHPRHSFPRNHHTFLTLHPQSNPNLALFHKCILCV